MITFPPSSDAQPRSDKTVHGRIDELGRVLLPVVLVASDGFELEMEAQIVLQFSGFMVIPEELANSIGWRSLGARRVKLGTTSQFMSHFVGLVSLGTKHENISALGGLDDRCLIGQRLLAGRTLTVDFLTGKVSVTI
jgi:predicted aspartyl protease